MDLCASILCADLHTDDWSTNVGSIVEPLGFGSIDADDLPCKHITCGLKSMLPLSLSFSSSSFLPALPSWSSSCNSAYDHILICGANLSHGFVYNNTCANLSNVGMNTFTQNVFAEWLFALTQTLARSVISIHRLSHLQFLVLNDECTCSWNIFLGGGRTETIFFKLEGGLSLVQLAYLLPGGGGHCGRPGFIMQMRFLQRQPLHDQILIRSCTGSDHAKSSTGFIQCVSIKRFSSCLNYHRECRKHVLGLMQPCGMWRSCHLSSLVAWGAPTWGLKSWWNEKSLFQNVSSQPRRMKDIHVVSWSCHFLVELE